MKKEINEKTETLAVIAASVLTIFVALVSFLILLPAVLLFGRN